MLNLINDRNITKIISRWYFTLMEFCYWRWMNEWMKCWFELSKISSLHFKDWDLYKLIQYFLKAYWWYLLVFKWNISPLLKYDSSGFNACCQCDKHTYCSMISRIKTWNNLNFHQIRVYVNHSVLAKTIRF